LRTSFQLVRLVGCGLNIATSSTYCDYFQRLQNFHTLGPESWRMYCIVGRLWQRSYHEPNTKSARH